MQHAVRKRKLVYAVLKPQKLTPARVVVPDGREHRQKLQKLLPKHKKKPPRLLNQQLQKRNLPEQPPLLLPKVRHLPNLKHPKPQTARSVRAIKPHIRLHQNLPLRSFPNQKENVKVRKKPEMANHVRQTGRGGQVVRRTHKQVLVLKSDGKKQPKVMYYN